jgi:hypothetical protein
MIAMQYTIELSDDYEMDTIRERVKNNGFKTDGFDYLKFKAYLITEKGVNQNSSNTYAPLYFWNDSKGMNKFIFGGYYDNILGSFGWQQIKTAIPLIDCTSRDIVHSKYILQTVKEIQPQKSLLKLTDTIEKEISEIASEYAVVYNPQSWSYTIFQFLTEEEKKFYDNSTLYEVLHVSLDG